MKWYSPSQVLTAKHVPYPQLTATQTSQPSPGAGGLRDWLSCLRPRSGTTSPHRGLCSYYNMDILAFGGAHKLLKAENHPWELPLWRYFSVSHDCFQGIPQTQPSVWVRSPCSRASVGDDFHQSSTKCQYLCYNYIHYCAGVLDDLVLHFKSQKKKGITNL